MERVDGLHVGRAERIHGAVGELRFHDALAQTVARHGAGYRGGARIYAALPVAEEKYPVLDDRAAQGDAELIAHQRRSRHTCLVVEEVIRGEPSVAVELV